MQSGSRVMDGGSASWSAWSPAGAVPDGKAVGRPAGWLNSTGAAGVAALDGNLMLAVTDNTGSGWAPWTELGGGF